MLKVVYVVELAPIVILKAPSHMVKAVEHLPGIPHVSKDIVFAISVPPINNPGKVGLALVSLLKFYHGV